MVSTDTVTAAPKTTASSKTTPAARKPRATSKPRTAKTAVNNTTEAHAVTTETVAETVEYPIPGQTAQQQALVNSYWSLKNAGLPVPDAIRVPVEQMIAQVRDEVVQEREAQANAEKAHEEKIQHLNETGPLYIRNMTHTEFNLRLDSQQGNGNIRPRRIQLKPRGMRGDMHPIKEEDHQDPILITNLNMGLLELIPAGVAQTIIEKQTRNMNQQKVHPSHQILANEYKILRDNHVDVAEHPTIKIEAEYNSQGITVATVDPRVSQGGFEDKTLQRSGDLQGGLSRTSPEEVRSQFIPTNGQAASIQIAPTQNLSSEQVRKIRDDIARRTDLEGPAAGLGNVRVVVEPTRTL